MFRQFVDQAADQFPLRAGQLQERIDRKLIVRIDPIFAALLADFAALVAVLQLLRLDREHFCQRAQIRLPRHRTAVEPAGNRLLRYRFAAEPGEQFNEFGRALAHAGLAKCGAEALAEGILFGFHAPTLSRRRARCERRGWRQYSIYVVVRDEASVPRTSALFYNTPGLHEFVDYMPQELALRLRQLQESLDRQLVARIEPVFPTALANALAVIAVLKLLRFDRKHFRQRPQIGLPWHGAPLQPAGNGLLGYGLPAETREQADEFDRALDETRPLQRCAQPFAERDLFIDHHLTLGRCTPALESCDLYDIKLFVSVRVFGLI